MASTNAARVQAQLFQGVDTAEPALSYLNLVLDLLTNLGTNGNGSGPPAADVLAQLDAVASPNSARALRDIRRMLNQSVDAGR